MKKIMVCIGIFMLFTTMVFPLIGTVFAGSEENPEITDNYDDHFGVLIRYPSRIRTFIALKLLNIKSFEFIDIDSAWFYEKELEPQFIYTAIKLKDLEPVYPRAIYSLHWVFNNKPYAVACHLYDNAENSASFVGRDTHFNRKWEEAEVSYDFNNNFIILKINKIHIGNPQPGERLTQTNAWTALRFQYEPFCLFFGDGELVKDGAPFIEDHLDFGKDYIIQY
jgi:hypothetical protein